MRIDSEANTESLNVWYEELLVGMLWRDATGKLGFQYDNDWLTDGFSISQQLPLSQTIYEPAENKANQFFVNLLPEAGARIHIVRDLKITNSDFELLKAIGGECAGALSILPIDENPKKIPNYKLLSDEEFKLLLLRKGNTKGFTAEKDKPRLSLAGAQDKSPIFFDGKCYYLPEDAAPSTHILKFEIEGYRHVPAYEYFLAKLASTIDLPTVNSTFKKFEDIQYLLVERYDRINSDENIQRLHQEDFCQALGVSYEKKYQLGGGPSFSDCYQLIQSISTQPIVDTENLLKWQIFNYLAGNSDGHAKNLALLYDTNMQVTLAPFYDLVCTRAIARIDTKLAMSIGDEFNPSSVSIKHWKQLAGSCDVRYQYLIKLIEQMAETIIENVNIVKDRFEQDNGAYPALQRVQQVVVKQCRKVISMLKI